jgi:hypothetical protein
MDGWMRVMVNDVDDFSRPRLADDDERRRRRRKMPMVKTTVAMDDDAAIRSNELSTPHYSGGESMLAMTIHTIPAR